MPAPERLILLDVDRIGREMRENGISERQLCKALRMHPAWVGRLRHGDTHADVTLAVFDRLRHALGIPHEELLLRSTSEPAGSTADAASATTDARTLGALLLESDGPIRATELAAALQWPLGRVVTAADRLAYDAPAVGAVLTKTLAGYRLRPDRRVVSTPARHALDQARRKRRDLNTFEASVLVAIREDDFSMPKRRQAPPQYRYLVGGNRLPAAYRLLALGYIEPKTETTFRLTREASFALGATNRKPFRHRRAPQHEA